jgi:hypothetical protein
MESMINAKYQFRSGRGALFAQMRLDLHRSTNDWCDEITLMGVKFNASTAF